MIEMLYCNLRVTSQGRSYLFHTPQSGQIKDLSETLAATEGKAEEASQQLAEARRRLSDIEGTMMPGLQVRNGDEWSMFARSSRSKDPLMSVIRGSS